MGKGDQRRRLRRSTQSPRTSLTDKILLISLSVQWTAHSRGTQTKSLAIISQSALVEVLIRSETKLGTRRSFNSLPACRPVQPQRIAVRMLVRVSSTERNDTLAVTRCRSRDRTERTNKPCTMVSHHQPIKSTGECSRQELIIG